MKFSCEKHLLSGAIAIASRASAAKSPIQALEGLLIEAGSDLQITGYDLKKGIYTKLPADVSEPGSMVLGAKLFGEIVRSLPEGIVTIETGKNNLTTICCEQSEFSIIGTDPEDYPDLPSVEYQNSVSLPQKLLRTMIGETIFAISDNESRPIYTGSLFEVNGNELTLVSVDGYRLALRREQISQGDLENGSFIVPGNALSDLQKICEDTDELVKITVGSKHISFSLNGTVLISRRLEGEFLNYRKSISDNFNHEIEVERTALARTVERVSLIIDDKIKHPLRCTFGRDEIKMVCSTGLGKAEDICICKGDGAGLEIGFNNRYLLDAIRAAPADKLLVCLNSGSTPCILKAADGGNSFLYMILPVRLRAGE
jgi:DNA polymerase-3 subunit beta